MYGKTRETVSIAEDLNAFMIKLFPFKLWSTTVYLDGDHWEKESSYSQTDTILYPHSNGICVIISTLDPSTEADEDFLNKYDATMQHYAD